MRRISLGILLAGILPLLGGCPQVSNIRITGDSPADLETLVNNHEYVRVRQLTGKHPSLDSAELQARLKIYEQEYEQSIWTEAGTLEADGNLHAAVRLLSDALQKIPHSDRLREMRNSIEQDRIRKLRINEREKLLASGEHLAEQMQLYEDSIKLEPPDRSRQQEQEHNQADATRLADQLRMHARFAMEDDDLNASRTCLELSRKLHDSPATIALQSELQAIERSLKKTTQQKASIKKARFKRKQNQEHKVQTEILLAETRLALKTNQLHTARDTFTRIPQSRSNDSEVMAVRTHLEQAVSLRTKKLIASGDSQYRADNINAALKSWAEAQSLDPDNNKIRERTERATRVLARLDELKQQQK